MKSFFVLWAAVLLAIMDISAQKVERIPLYADNDEAEMFVYLPEKESALHSAILICPGGGYGGLAIDNEGYNMAEWYSSKGMATNEQIRLQSF